MTAITYADILRPRTRVQATTYDLGLIVAGSLLIALSAQIALPVPFSPVPVTGQTLAVLLAGLLLGSRRGALAVLAYLGEGAIGLPVFAGGTGGAAVLLGPTGGFLLGFVAAAYVTGLLAERGWDRLGWTALLAMLAGNAVIYGLGLPRLAAFTGWDSVLAFGLVPFIVGDVAKAVFAMLLLPAGWRLINR